MGGNRISAHKCDPSTSSAPYFKFNFEFRQNYQVLYVVPSVRETMVELAALLAALGIYGVLAYVVVQRTREIGIRMALGAVAGQVRLLIVKEVGSMVLIGVVVGLPLAYVLARFSESLLYGVHAGDPAVYALGLGLIALIALAACFIPARRATRVDPLVALRYQ